MKRSVVVFGFLAACSNGTSPSDGGASDVVTQDVTTNDASSDATPDVATDGSSLSVPQTLDQAGKLALWLEATTADVVLGDGGVAGWKDKSKNKNDATAGGTSPSVQSSALAGHDAVHFSLYTDTLTIADAASLRFATDPVYITAVAKVLTLRAFFFGKFDGNNANAGLSFFTAPSGTTTDAGAPIPTLYLWFDTTGDQATWTGTELGDAKFHIVSFRRNDATNIELAIDDLAAQPHVLSAADISALGQPLQIGPIGGPAPPDFSLVEELVVHAPADADVASLHAYLKAKYSL